MNELPDNPIPTTPLSAADNSGVFPGSPLGNSLSEHLNKPQQLPTEQLEAFRLKSKSFNLSSEELLSFGSASLLEQNQADTKAGDFKKQPRNRSTSNRSQDVLTGKTRDAALVQDVDTISDDKVNSLSNTQTNKRRASSRKAERNIESALPSLDISGTKIHKPVVADAMKQVKDHLQQFASDPKLIPKMQKAFGQDWQADAARNLIERLLDNDRSKSPLIKVEVVSKAKLKVEGAFAAQTNTIYLSKPFLSQQSGNSELVAAVLLEEIGHYLDAQLNTTDSPGDEGAIFSLLVQGGSISQDVLQRLKAEDDSAVLMDKGKRVTLEEATVYGTTGNDNLQGGSADDALYGLDGNDLLIGNAGNDLLATGHGSDYLEGGDGNDQLIAEYDDGGDTLVGGLGDDYYGINFANLVVVVERAGQGTDTVGTLLSMSLMDLKDSAGNVANIENLRSAIPVTSNLTLMGNSLNNTITGSNGNDSLYGGNGDDLLLTGNGSDYLEGGDGNDQLITQYAEGVDTLVGGLGNDYYAINSANLSIVIEQAGQGTDTLGTLLNMDLNQIRDSAGNIADIENLIAAIPLSNSLTLLGNSLNNVIRGSNGSDVLEGKAGDDLLQGEAGNDTLIGGEGNDILHGSTPGIDFMMGGAGNDTYHVGPDDSISETIADGGVDLVITGISYNLEAVGASAAGIENLELWSGAGAINATGNALNNTITGNSYNNTLDGRDGDDILEGKAGDDTLLGGRGNDTLIGGDGNDNLHGSSGGIDFMVGGAGNDTYHVGEFGGTISETVADGGIDLIITGISYNLEAIGASVAGVENIQLWNGASAINATGNALNNTIIGNSYNNTLEGRGGDDIIVGELGNDVLEGGDGNDNLNGNAGDDVVSGNNGIDYIWGSDGNDKLYGDDGNDSLNGEAGDDTVVGGLGNDGLEGGEGNDKLDGGIGNDTLIGGAGNDSYYIDSTGDIIVEAANGGRDTIHANFDFSIADLVNVESLWLEGNAIRGTGNAGSNGLVGNAQNNILIGGDGGDSLYGQAGVDTLIGGAGGDTYYIDSTDEIIIEEGDSGTDWVQSSANFSLANLPNVEHLILLGSALHGTGNANDNYLGGNAQNNTLTGGNGKDNLHGGAGNDTLIGGAGDDNYYVDSLGDIVVEEVNGGEDSIHTSIDFSLADTPHIEDLYLYETGMIYSTAIRGTGNALDNQISGNHLNNILIGGEGNDLLSGDAGTDTLIGGAGNDQLRGSSGADRLIADSGADLLSGGSGADKFELSSFNRAVVTIQDFSAAENDAIQIGLGDSATQLQASQFRAGAGFNTAITESQRVIYNTTTGELFYDADGSGAQFNPVHIATLQNKAAISAANISLSTSSMTSIAIDLQQDTAPGGITNADRLTFDPTIKGNIKMPGRVVELLASFDDPASSNNFVTVASTIATDGSFTISKAQLATVNGGSLSDGSHTLYLRAKDELGNVSEVVNTSFTLDTTAPTQTAISLIDGITWTEGERLQGKINNVEPGTVVTYRFDDQGETILSLDATGAFDKFLDIPNSFGSHTLKLTSTDQAGNLQTSEFNFLVKQPKSAVDDDLLVPPPDEDDPDGGGNPNGGTNFGSHWLTSGGSRGPWGRGGVVSAGDGGLGGNPPPPYEDDPGGYGYGDELPTYLEKVALILDQAVSSIGTGSQTIHKKAALKNRVTLLMEIADMVDQGRFYNRMSPVFHAIYDQADNDPIVYESDAVAEGYILAGDIVGDSDAVKVETFQTTLLAVVNQVLVDTQYSPASWAVYQPMVDALLQLARTYAALNPTKASDAATTSTPDFLDSLWRAQKTLDPYTPLSSAAIRDELQTAISALTELLEGVDNPLQAIQFVNNLVQAATNVESLSDDGVLDAQFFRELVSFGFEYAKLNPTNLATATENGLEAFLATLWQSGSAPANGTAMRQATGKLSDLFKSMNTKEERIKVIGFEKNLLKAAKQLPQHLQEQSHDIKFLSAFVELGGVYADSNPVTDAALWDQTLISSLATIWQAQNEQEIENGANKLTTFFENFSNPVDRLNSVVLGEHALKLAQNFPEFLLAQNESVPPPSSVKPIYQVYRVFPGQGHWFMQHYFDGSGEPVDLGTWGLLDEYRNAPDVIRGIDQLRFRATERIHSALTPINPIVTGESFTEVNATGTIYAMGKSTLGLKFTATLDTTKEPLTGRYTAAPNFISYAYKLKLEYSVEDRFVDAPDAANLIPDEPVDVPLLADPLRTLSVGGIIEFPGGTPYDLTASWTIEDELWTSPYP